MDYRDELLKFFDEMKKTGLFHRMEQTVEGSPWHREANVLVHTEMVVDEYIKLTDELTDEHVWTCSLFLGGIAAVFHDTGKPDAKITKHSKERGTYFAFHGHEILSARIWEDYAVSNNLEFDSKEISAVSWMIEHHMPWQITDNEKLVKMANTILYYNISRAFVHELLADQYGRIADNQEGKNAAAREWVESFNRVIRGAMLLDNAYVVKEETKDMPTLYVSVAPSGAGKTTLRKLIEQEDNVLTFSLDDLRHEFYNTTDYAKAYKKSVDDKTFQARANQRFMEIVKTGKSIFVDNTNLSVKRRAFYVNEAKRRGYKTVAYLLPISLDVLIERQKTRGDKSVPENAVRQQYFSLQMPSIGEFDEIITLEQNFTEL